MGKTENMQKQASTVNRGMETLRKCQEEILEIKTEMKSVFDELTHRLNMAKEGISELEDRTIETFQTEMQREKWKIKIEYPRTVGQLQKVQYE